jgi:DNA polymerase III epsilon subunit-like protein
MFIYLDTETTGSGPEDRLCQIAFKTGTGTTLDELFNPEMPISVEAMSIHHITNEMVADKPPFKDSDAYKQLQVLFATDDSILVAHNAKFDVSMLNRENLYPQKSICTYKLSRYLDKEGIIPKYNLQYLRYYLKLNIDATAHTAIGDVLVLEGVFQRIHAKFKGQAIDPVADMINISSSPVLVPRMPFGKHKGLKMAEVPKDYLQWLSGTDLDEDLGFTVGYYLGNPIQDVKYDASI